MAAAAELCVLLFALISNTHAEELVIQKRMSSYTFNPPEQATFCLISRSVGEEQLVLWNISHLWSGNVSVPEDVKQRLSVVSRDGVSSYIIHNLTLTDSGLYREECWTEGRVTHEKDTTLTICGRIDAMDHVRLDLGQRLELRCKGTADILDTVWLRYEDGYDGHIWKYVWGGDKVMDDIKGRFQVAANTPVLDASNFTATDFTLYVCLVMYQQQCVSSQPVVLSEPPEIIYHSVGETAVLPCALTNYTDVPVWININQMTVSYTEESRNDSLVFSPLTLNHSGVYSCEANLRRKTYFLIVCPRFGPPAVEFFSQGDNVSLNCDQEGHYGIWFIKSNRTGGRVLHEFSLGPDLRISKVIANMSVEDTGEYWCAVIGEDYKCLSTTKTLLKYREPFGLQSIIYTARCSVLSGLLVLLCAVVGSVIQRTRRGEQP